MDINPVELLEYTYRRLLGPFDYPEDLMRDKPYGFYTVGILDSRKKIKEKEKYKGEEEIISEEEGATTEEEGEEEIYLYEQSELDPRDLPYSTGVIFSYDKGKNGVFEFKLFLTYALYKKHKDEDGEYFLRNPYEYAFNLNSEEIKKGKRIELEGNAVCFIIQPDENKIFISLVNERSGELSKEERCIYQPYIGIKAVRGRILSEDSRDKVTRSFKGALVSVISNKELLDLKEIYGDTSFVARDMSSFLRKHGMSLENLDLLTTYIPFYFKLQPVHAEYNFALSSEEDDDGLLESFIAEAEKMINDYSVWSRLQEEDTSIPESKINDIKLTVERMTKSLLLLKNEEDVRKAFAFACKTSAKAAEWAGIRNFNLRPFQAAYILTVLETLVNPSSEYKYFCDILNVPTGAGKTEAYLLLAVFYAAYRRLKYGERGYGTAVFSRYTLRMLTVQQFLRTLRTFTAAEYLRIKEQRKEFGEEPFSVGLWVGQGITPNYLVGRPISGKWIPGMIDYLKYGRKQNRAIGQAGIVSVCPACGIPLVIPKDFLKDENEKEIYIPFGEDTHECGEYYADYIKEEIENAAGGVEVLEIKFRPGYLYLKLKGPAASDIAEILDKIWENLSLPCEPLLKNPRTDINPNFDMKYPGFRYPGYRVHRNENEYEIRCPNINCELNEYNIPIRAYTVDDYLYQNPPTFLISTVDKIAQLPCKDEALNLFGKNTEPPGLIIQDEIHLIEGPMGSLFGLYETAVDFLCKNKAKYISSSATVKEADIVSNNALAREVFLFPVTLDKWDIRDSFFLKYPLKLKKGSDFRLYAGICAFGKGPGTPQVDTYEALFTFLKNKGIRHPIVGYYNEIKELSRAVGFLKQDVSGRLQRSIIFTELSSRIRSEKIGSVLKEIERNFNIYDAILTTSIFGTGVDIPGLSVMVMRGQPKRTADYIQATGRVGRKGNSFVFVIYGNTRPRDISHFEYFVPYHRDTEKFIEDPSVYPFAISIFERVLPAIGVIVFKKEFRGNQTDLAKRMTGRLQDILSERNGKQLPEFRLDSDVIRIYTENFSQKFERCITKSGMNAKCLFSIDMRGSFILTPLPDMIEDVVQRTCFQNIPSSLRNTEGEILLEIRGS